MDYDFAKRWAHLKGYIVRVSGEPVALNKLRAATKHRLETCDPETLTVSYLQYQILGDVYHDISGNEIQSEPPRWSREPYEQKIEKEILLSLVTDRNVGLDILERQIETNAQEYVMGTRNAVAAPVTSPPLVHQARSSETGNQTTSASSPALAPSQPPPPPQRGLADPRWASEAAVATNSQARQSQTLKPETRYSASVTAQYPALPGPQGPHPTPAQPEIANLGQAQAMPVVTTQSLQQKTQRELADKVKLLDQKMAEPQSMGAGPWEILLPRSVDPLGSIKPYQRVLQDLLGVNLVIKADRLEVGQSVFQLPGRPPLVRTAVTLRRRVSAYTDLAAYVKHSRDTGVAPDIVEFLLARHVDAIDKLGSELAELGASKQAILGSKVAAPVAPHGEYLRYCAEKPNPREGQAPNPGNKNTGEERASRKNNTTTWEGTPPDSATPSSHAVVPSRRPRTSTPDHDHAPSARAIEPLNFDIKEFFDADQGAVQGADKQAAEESKDAVEKEDGKDSGSGEGAA
ncbi:hypothetical protein DL768_004428 [Monosporascus sp. mg162]|nr:hypothetical protein DL768_004428 [Monosporascus sp. mg162]